MRAYLQVTLTAAFLAAFSWPALATDYYFETGQGAGVCSEADPCSTIAQLNALDLNAGDNVFFNCGDTFNDVDLTIAAGDAGAEGNPVTLTQGGPTACTGANDPIISRVVDGDFITISASYIIIDGLSMNSSEKAGIGSATIQINGTDLTDITLQNCTVAQDLAGGAGGNGTAVRADANAIGLSNFLIDNCIIEDAFGVLLHVGEVVDNFTITNSTIRTNVGGPNPAGANDVVQLDTANSIWTDVTVDGTNRTNGGFNIDILHNGTHVFTRLTNRISGSNALMHVAGNDIAAPEMNVTIDDSFFENTGRGQGWMFVRDDVTLTVDRTRYVGHDAAFGIRIGNRNGDNPTVFFNASTCELEAGDAGDNCFEFSPAADPLTGGRLAIANSTLTVRNGAAAVAAIEIGATTGVPDLDIVNTISDGAGVLLVSEDAASTVDLGGWSDNLWFGDAAPTAIFALDDQGNLDADDVGVTAPLANDTFGDPLFASEDETSPLYLRLLIGSPGIAMGDPANLYDGATSTDLLGIPFNSARPNAGARAHGIRQRMFHHMQQSALQPSNDNAPLRAAA
ncbi:MAG TPA: hypothetical protein VGA50_04670 [Kiloniellales bacterium]